LVPRIRNFYLKQMLLKLEKELSVTKAKAKLKELMIQIKQMPEYKNIQVVVDVDPM
jgi:primosomal protein N' (replication factor Y) (superfamily II helicase)